MKSKQFYFKIRLIRKNEKVHLLIYDIQNNLKDWIGNVSIFSKNYNIIYFNKAKFLVWQKRGLDISALDVFHYFLLTIKFYEIVF